MNPIDKVPRGEVVVASYFNKHGKQICVLTLRQSSGIYVLYECTDVGLTRLGKDTSPLELERKYDTRKRMGA